MANQTVYDQIAALHAEYADRISAVEQESLKTREGLESDLVALAKNRHEECEALRREEIQRVLALVDNLPRK